VLRVCINGQHITQPLGADPEAARQAAEQLIARYREARARNPGRPILATVAALADAWRERYVPEHRPGAKAQKLAKQRLADHILPIIGSLNLLQVRKHHLTDLKASLRSKGLAVNSQRHILSDVRCMFSWAVDEEIMDYSPFAGKKVLPPKPEVTAPKYLTDIELARILSLAPEPYRSCIVLGVRTGMRWGEQRNLRWRDVELETQDPSLLVVKTKGKRPRRIPLDGETVAILKRWQSESGGAADDYVAPWRPKQGE
jgi:integrase